MPAISTDSRRLAPEILPPANALGQMVKGAYVMLARGRYSWVWVVPVCPYCGKPHDHYGGSLDSDPYRYIGQVLFARCDQTDRRRLALQYPTADLRYTLVHTEPNEPPQESPLLHYMLARMQPTEPLPLQESPFLDYLQRELSRLPAGAAMAS